MTKKTKYKKHIKAVALVLFAMVLVVLMSACSTTSRVPNDDQLFIGLTKIDYKDYEKNDHFLNTQDEIEAALATAPNGALFGSSYYRTPFPYSLWLWNAFSGSKGKIPQWLAKTFGKAPVLMSRVNPQLRASVAQSVLRNHGYLNGTVDFKVETQKNPKKAKIGYTVRTGRLFRIDTFTYVNFPAVSDSLINATRNEAVIKTGSPFDASKLDEERSRLARLFRNNGYYYYQPGFASFLADTTGVPGNVNLRLQLANNLDPRTQHKWYIGRIKVDLRKQFMEELHDSLTHRYLTIRFNGRRPPVRPRVVLKDMKLRPRDVFSYDNYTESAGNINNTGLFSSVEFAFTPRDSSATCDTLDLNLTCTFNKPYDFYVETNYTNKINGRTGPELVLGFTKRNAFRGGELLDINLHGSYEWQQGGNITGSSSDVNSYEYGADVSVSFPRLLVPFLKQRRSIMSPTTIAKASTNTLNRPKYFRMHTVSGEWTYRWQRSDIWKHEFSPLTLQYQRLNTTTAKFDSIVQANPYLKASMQNVFIPKMRYTLSYSSARKHLNPLVWNVTLTEAGNFLSLGYMATGHKWAEKEKTLFKNPYAQFVKLDADITKTWRIDRNNWVVAHAAGGVICTYGNYTTAPYSEQFYVGGANSIRAFAVRSIGPGKYTTTSNLSYLDQTGDIKLQFNLEYRFRLFGSLFGATFLDAGNVWAMRGDDYRKGSQFKLKNALSEMAVGTGVGIRYDLEFLVLRLDWGVGLHVPYETSRSGFYNIPRFKDGQTLHLAVGYPF